jgi:flagellar motor switch protein FliN/FliY
MSEETNAVETEEAVVAEATTPAGEKSTAGQDYAPAEFDNLKQEPAHTAQDGTASLDVILDIPVTLSMEIGHTRISIQELLQLARGSVVELDRMAGEPLDVLVNGTLVARGEVVVVNDKFGVRLSDVLSPAERVGTLK